MHSIVDMPSQNMGQLKDRLDRVRKEVRAALLAAGRSEKETTIVAVSKKQPASSIEALFKAGQKDFGENYVQEAVEKIQQLSHLEGIEWHFIGPIQSNKTSLLAQHFNWVQSVDRVKIIKRLSEQRPADMPALNICLQINISNEASKSGASIEDLPSLVAAINECPNLVLRGFMAIPEKGQASLSFAKMDQLFKQYQVDIPTMDTLSMGMSGDMAQAIEHGTTMVRIGTAIFGARN